MGCDHTLHGVLNIGAVMVERRQCTDDSNHDSHGMGAANKTAVEANQLFMQHRVLTDVRIKISLFFR